MSLDRRRFLAASLGLAIAGPAAAQSYGQTFKVENDEGRPVANMRLPGEITGQIQELRGVTYVGPREAEVTLYEFFDYNCPWCRKAAADVTALAASDPALRIGLVHNPILSPMSAQAAKVSLAVQRKLGSAAAFAFYGQLLATKGQIDGLKALEIGAKAGVTRAELEQIADSDEVREAMRAHMTVAANLGLTATPSYVLGNTGVLGHPGVKSLAKMIGAMRRCDQIACG
ncbi:UNVERIFIED_ORG: protein-disulfide isomerase [Methylobacterium sp. SuP10 SLI 274]|uniref:DsbA family protein n=1 Tax=Methylorubrum extorquens TaxID=408 RepID=UPI0020A05316|nr:DsbA family protein [Methylorubrum extorquens]MDF9866233.1 protein-disulfide isomerase [Methylorubrum pseudosasae]MDH6639775.1 protein-disulfide isomerase [Methylobacterium sp. SuP10 SLI 274]MDH6668971.1 protein-disulfide isomerase [Methylorubrum zatmanii]MCP1560849.1 protein-disulfide isomerase [Methylorubrum extorquens]MDF9794527.1 protein-disulfide isomerase [Methylorubrum extorquens]